MTTPSLGLSGLKALVLASSRGLGFASAHALAVNGASVVMASGSDGVWPAAERVHAAAQAAGAGGSASGTLADVTRDDDVKRAVATAAAALGGLNTVVVNSGGPPPGAFSGVTLEDWGLGHQLCLMPLILAARHAVPIMAEGGGGSITTIQSCTVKQPMDGMVISNTYRAAAAGLSKSLANELGPQGIRVNLIGPGLTATERFHAVAASKAAEAGVSTEAMEAAMASAVPLGRVNSADNFGLQVAWLASPAASYITGQCILVDGGMTQCTM